MDSQASDRSEPLALFWDAVLSRQPERIRAVVAPLDTATRKSVVAHLQRMIDEAGWHPEQRQSAQAALDAIHDLI